jgi:anhydro-N-acetylmuramic acid kinase
MTEYQFTVLGLMSGTSLDGVDIAICSFREKKEGWNYDILFTRTYPYDKEWKSKLKCAYNIGGRELMGLDRIYGDYLAVVINSAVTEYGTIPDLIASHGHTIFHSPENRMTCQIGHGGNISAGTRLPVVCDFRSTDVSLGGQGAPLVPIGDKLLFSEFNSCLNLGGFANISFDINGQRRAFDISPVNIVLNELAGQLGFEYDDEGSNGQKGVENEIILEQLNSLEFYHRELPKSLGYEWYEINFLPLLSATNISIYDKLATVYKHISEQISKVLNHYELKDVLVTGGGTHNKYLIDLVSSLAKAKLIIPDLKVIDYKEAIIFAFLGLLRFQNRINILASVTGAERDSIGGAIYMP